MLKGRRAALWAAGEQAWSEPRDAVPGRKPWGRPGGALHTVSGARSGHASWSGPVLLHLAFLINDSWLQVLEKSR